MKNIAFRTFVSTEYRAIRGIVIAVAVGVIAITDVQPATLSTAVASATVATTENPLNDHGWD